MGEGEAEGDGDKARPKGFLRWEEPLSVEAVMVGRLQVMRQRTAKHERQGQLDHWNAYTLERK